ncbi:MAG: cob(I)yrinic acid a,c-diamide adenosyltransferase [Elusimicrobia bacterium]|nr:cob(I)yrinic acid a,c-diamide adenosyltransferase [Elusimicrobiota bacterium]MBD3411760.1 cob(I)yrinic acid a,c-diamide adenosyltransferase [Elusimicrobiota bacterium]
MKKTGLIHIYTGDGKGKTTAAVGLAIRALGRGYSVAWVQFCKDVYVNPSGEIILLKKLGVDVFQFASKIPYFDKTASIQTIKNECRKGLKKIGLLFRKQYRLIVCDEIILAAHLGYIRKKELRALIRTKPLSTELILTGRGISKDITGYADYITEMKKIKHPYDRRVLARKGIEF